MDEQLLDNVRLISPLMSIPTLILTYSKKFQVFYDDNISAIKYLIKISLTEQDNNHETTRFTSYSYSINICTK